MATLIVMGREFGLSFSLMRLLGITSFKQGISLKYGIPLTELGFNAKLSGGQLGSFSSNFTLIDTFLKTDLEWSFLQNKRET